MAEEDIETLLKIAGEKPYYGPDYSIKRRRLTEKLKNIFAKYFDKFYENIRLYQHIPAGV
jgi:hypothetical protein